MRCFRVWLKEDGFVAEGVEWSDNSHILAHRIGNQSGVYWEFSHMNRLRDYIFAAFGPDAHLIMSSAGELRFERPGLLPANKSSEPGQSDAAVPLMNIPEKPEEESQRPRKGRRKVGGKLVDADAG